LGEVINGRRRDLARVRARAWVVWSLGVVWVWETVSMAVKTQPRKCWVKRGRDEPGGRGRGGGVREDGRVDTERGERWMWFG
jgi:hypothetical protein